MMLVPSAVSQVRPVGILILFNLWVEIGGTKLGTASLCKGDRGDMRGLAVRRR